MFGPLTVTTEVTAVLGVTAADIQKMTLCQLADLVWSKGLKIKVHPFRETIPAEQGDRTIVMDIEADTLALRKA